MSLLRRVSDSQVRLRHLRATDLPVFAAYHVDPDVAFRASTRIPKRRRPFLVLVRQQPRPRPHRAVGYSWLLRPAPFCARAAHWGDRYYDGAALAGTGFGAQSRARIASLMFWVATTAPGGGPPGECRLALGRSFPAKRLVQGRVVRRIPVRDAWGRVGCALVAPCYRSNASSVPAFHSLSPYFCPFLISCFQ